MSEVVSREGMKHVVDLPAGEWTVTRYKDTLIYTCPDHGPIMITDEGVVRIFGDNTHIRGGHV
jgi:hypothetical protein